MSLRDIVRAIQLFKFFCEYLSNTERKVVNFSEDRFASRDVIRRSLILSLSHCYHNRLTFRIFLLFLSLSLIHTHIHNASSDTRQAYREAVCVETRRLPMNSYLRMEEDEFDRVVRTSQEEFAERMDVGRGDGIALNKALCENLFMIFVSVLNKIPIFVIGKPGSSKSLAMEVLSSRFNGEVSRNDFLRSFPPMQVRHVTVIELFLMLCFCFVRSSATSAVLLPQLKVSSKPSKLLVAIMKKHLAPVSSCCWTRFIHHFIFESVSMSF